FHPLEAEKPDEHAADRTGAEHENKRDEDCTHAAPRLPGTRPAPAWLSIHSRSGAFYNVHEQLVARKRLCAITRFREISRPPPRAGRGPCPRSPTPKCLFGRSAPPTSAMGA